MNQLDMLQREIQDSMEELEKISPLHENQVTKEICLDIRIMPVGPI